VLSPCTNHWTSSSGRVRKQPHLQTHSLASAKIKLFFCKGKTYCSVIMCLRAFCLKRRRRRFRIGTRQRSWTRPVAWKLIPLTALWAGEGRAQLSQHTAQVSRINRLDRYTCSPGHRTYCCAELTVPSLAMALTTASTYFTIPQRVEGWVDLVGWLRTVDSHPSKY